MLGLTMALEAVTTPGVACEGIALRALPCAFVLLASDTPLLHLLLVLFAILIELVLPHWCLSDGTVGIPTALWIQWCLH